MEYFEILNWSVFTTVVGLILFLELRLLRNTNKQGYYFTKRTLSLHTLLLVMISFCFAIFIYYTNNSKDALDFITCYFLEISLSVDNLFVFLLIFKFMKIKETNQHRVLFWGIIGAIILRLIFIYFGFSLTHKFDKIFYVFAIMLLYSGYRMISQNHSINQEVSDENGVRLINFISKIFRVSDDMSDNSFFIRNQKDKKIYVTHAFIALIIIEKADLLFAVESITAALSISDNFFVIFSANIFAIIVLRSVYSFTVILLERFKSLHYGLAAIFIFIGSKIILGLHGIHITNAISLASTIMMIIIPCLFDYTKKYYQK